MIKTDSEMLHKAIAIAQQTKTTVAFVVASVPQLKYFMAMAKDNYSVIAEGVVTHGQPRISFPKGGKIMFLSADRSDDGRSWAGFQFSHVFVVETLSTTLHNFLRSRVRSPYHHDEPCGLYDRCGVERRESY